MRVNKGEKGCSCSFHNDLGGFIELSHFSPWVYCCFWSRLSCSCPCWLLPFGCTRHPSCQISPSPTCPSSQDSLRPRCLHPLLTTRSCVTMMTIKTPFSGSLTRGLTRSDCWMFGHLLSGHPCTRSVPLWMKQVRPLSSRAPKQVCCFLCFCLWVC